jgi:hypothetical protein
MILDDLSARTLILLGVFIPPLLTLICWFIGRRIVRGPKPQVKGGFWGLLLAAYVLCAVALYSSRYFAGTARNVDPSVQVLQ